MATSKFRYSSKSNPCPICNDISGKCRDNGDVYLCMTLSDSRVGEIIGEYKCIANKSSGWATFKINNSQEWNEEKKREWEERKQQRDREQAKEDEERRRRSLSAKERDRQYRLLLSQLELHPDDKADLLQRGFSEQEIEAHGFKSVCKNQKLSSPLLPALPGVKVGGWHLAVSSDGYLCPVITDNNLITGMQVRLRNPSDGNRYRWLSSSNAVLPLPNGENPIGLYLPPIEKPNGIALVEGVGAKPRLAAKLLNQVVIGAAGGQFRQSPEQLKNYLSLFKFETIALFLDAGEIANQQRINNVWQPLQKLLTEWGYKVKVGWWEQFSKEDRDIDEGVTKDEITYLDWGEIRKLSAIDHSLIKDNKGGDLTPRLNFDCFANGSPKYEGYIKSVQRNLRSLSFPVNIEIEQRYLPKSLVDKLPQSGIIGIKAPKGSGKSVLLKEIIKIAKQERIAVLSITPRIALGREQAIKWEITWIDDFGEVRNQSIDTTKQIDELAEKKQELQQLLDNLEETKEGRKKQLDDKKIMQIDLFKPDLLAKIEAEVSEIMGEVISVQEQIDTTRSQIEELSIKIDNINDSAIFTLGLCWDSLWRLAERDMRNSLIIIDEAELGFTHLATSSTCKSNRANLLKIFGEKIKNCITSGGRVILADADLTDVAVNYVQELLPAQVQPFIVVNTYKSKETRWTIDMRSGNRGDTVDLLMDAIKNGKYVAVTVDSQAEAEALERKILANFPELYLLIDPKTGTIRQGKLGNGVGRIDSRISATEAGKNFIKHINEAIKSLMPRVLIYTPSMGVGVSIDESTKRIVEDSGTEVPYFDLVFGFFFGVVEPSQCRQQLARVRANVDRTVWVQRCNRSSEGSAIFLPKEINRRMMFNHQYNLSPLTIAMASLDEDADDWDLKLKLDEIYAQSFDPIARCWKDPHLNLFTKLKARKNYGLWNLAALLQEELEDEGHDIARIEGEASDITKELAQIKKEIKFEDAEAIANSSVLASTEEARQVLASIRSTEKECQSAVKTLLADELPGIELTPDFVFKAVLKDRRRWLNSQRLFWYYTNPTAAKQIDTSGLISRFKKFAEENLVFMPDVRTVLPKIQAIEETRIFDWIDLNDPEKIYTGNSEEAQKFSAYANRKKETLSNILNVHPTKHEGYAIRLANTILQKMGLRLKKMTKSKSDNRYILDLDALRDTDRIAVLEALTRRWEAEKGEMDEKPAGQAFEHGEILPVYLNKKETISPLQMTIEESQEMGTSMCTKQLSTLPSSETMIDDVSQCLGWVREALREADPEFAGQVNSILTETAKAYPSAFKKGVWGELEEFEREAWRLLLMTASIIKGFGALEEFEREAWRALVAA